MNDNDRRKAADELGDGYTRLAATLSHIDRRRTNLAGQTEGDDMGVFDRMRFAFQGQPKSARYDGDSESAPAREPRCTCGHAQSEHVIGTDFGCLSDCRCRYYEPDSVRGLNSDPTGTAALRPDRANQDLRDHDKDTRAAAVILERMTARLAKYSQARPASDADRAALAKTNTHPPKVCDSCGDLPLKVENSTVKGNLTIPMALCGWCYEGVVRQGRPPSTEQKNIKAAGGKVRWPDANHVTNKGTAA